MRRGIFEKASTISSLDSEDSPEIIYRPQVTKPGADLPAGVEVKDSDEETANTSTFKESGVGSLGLSLVSPPGQAIYSEEKKAERLRQMQQAFLEIRKAELTQKEEGGRQTEIEPGRASSLSTPHKYQGGYTTQEMAHPEKHPKSHQEIQVGLGRSSPHRDPSSKEGVGGESGEAAASASVFNASNPTLASDIPNPGADVIQEMHGREGGAEALHEVRMALAGSRPSVAAPLGTREEGVKKEKESASSDSERMLRKVDDTERDPDNLGESQLKLSAVSPPAVLSGSVESLTDSDGSSARTFLFLTRKQTSALSGPSFGGAPQEEKEVASIGLVANRSDIDPDNCSDYSFVSLANSEQESALNPRSHYIDRVRSEQRTDFKNTVEIEATGNTERYSSNTQGLNRDVSNLGMHTPTKDFKAKTRVLVNPTSPEKEMESRAGSMPVGQSSLEESPVDPEERWQHSWSKPVSFLSSDEEKNGTDSGTDSTPARSVAGQIPLGNNGNLVGLNSSPGSLNINESVEGESLAGYRIDNGEGRTMSGVVKTNCTRILSAANRRNLEPAYCGPSSTIHGDREDGEECFDGAISQRRRGATRSTIEDRAVDRLSFSLTDVDEGEVVESKVLVGLSQSSKAVGSADMDASVSTAVTLREAAVHSIATDNNEADTAHIGEPPISPLHLIGDRKFSGHSRILLEIQSLNSGEQALLPTPIIRANAKTVGINSAGSNSARTPTLSKATYSSSGTEATASSLVNLAELRNVDDSSTVPMHNTPGSRLPLQVADGTESGQSNESIDTLPSLVEISSVEEGERSSFQGSWGSSQTPTSTGESSEAEKFEFPLRLMLDENSPHEPHGGIWGVSPADSHDTLARNEFPGENESVTSLHCPVPQHLTGTSDESNNLNNRPAPISSLAGESNDLDVESMN